jgi:hypothetical protein
LRARRGATAAVVGRSTRTLGIARATVVHTKEDYIATVLPYRMKSVDILNVALKYVISWDTPQSMEISFDGKVCVRGLSTGFTNPAIEAGLIHGRALLEFLGIKVDPKNPDRLIQRPSRKPDDLVIEDFSGPNGQLKMLSVAEVINAYPGPAEEAEKSLAALISCANKGIAHPTTGRIVNEPDLPKFEIASRGIPVLTINAFYTRLGLPPPEYKIQATRRADA